MWTGAPAPPAYIKRMLCREFHIPPHELKRVPLKDIFETLTILRVEGEVRAANAK